jgi:ABC-2 type transport system ATP-binding protein
VVISTAYLDEAERCTRLALLHRGELRLCDTPEALRKRLPGQMIVVASDAPERVQQVIASLPGVLGVRAVGDGVRAMVDDRSRRAAEIERALGASGLGGARVEPVQASVEDVFLELLQAEPREA